VCPSPRGFQPREVNQLPTVGITHNDAYPVADGIVREALAGLAEIRMIEMPTERLTDDQEARVAAALHGVTALLVRPGYLPRSLLVRCPDLRLIAMHATGVDKVDFQATADLGITVTHAPGGNALGVAELTIAMALLLVRQLIPTAAAAKQGLWNDARRDGTELSGKTLGVIGVGRIGSLVAHRALAFGMRVVAYDPAYTPEQFAARGIRWLPFGSVLEAADILTLHVPLDSSTANLVDAIALRRMKAGAFLLNLARGSILDEIALEAALRAGRLAGAALDARQVEPPGAGDTLRSLPNVILTPHIGGSTAESLTRMAEMCAVEIRRFLSGEPPINDASLGLSLTSETPDDRR
jgi:D-3-phosphoglycerate dehydrogenase / 2-oxoglutarate reductase